MLIYNPPVNLDIFVNSVGDGDGEIFFCLASYVRSESLCI